MIVFAFLVLIVGIIVVVFCRVMAGLIRQVNVSVRGGDVLSNTQRKQLRR